MATLTKLKQEIQFNGRLGGLLDALKSIAASQFQSLERTMSVNPPVFTALETIAGTFALDQLAHPFTQGEGPAGVIVVTSDTGLLGGLNQQVVAAAVQEYRQDPGELFVIGERGATLLREQGYVSQAYPGIQDSGRRALAGRVRDDALNHALSRRLGTLTIVYPHALSFSAQRVEVVPALPCTAWFEGSTVARGVRGGPVMLESSITDVVEYLVWMWLGQKLYEVFGLSRLAELSARAAHLEGSSQELGRRGRSLRQRYFRERREAIDRNIRELFAAKSLFSSERGES